MAQFYEVTLTWQKAGHIQAYYYGQSVGEQIGSGIYRDMAPILDLQN
jgi:hypothetical protein